MLGKRLYDLRKSRNLTQQELAAYLDCSVATVSSYENGHTEPSDEIKLKLCRLFDVSADYLLGVIPAPMPPQNDSSQERVILIPGAVPRETMETIRAFSEFAVSRCREEREPAPEGSGGGRIE